MFIFVVYIFYIIGYVFILVISADITVIAYFLGFFYNFLYWEEIVNLLAKDYFLIDSFFNIASPNYLILKNDFFKYSEFFFF